MDSERAANSKFEVMEILQGRVEKLDGAPEILTMTVAHLANILDEVMTAAEQQGNGHMLHDDMLWDAARAMAEHCIACHQEAGQAARLQALITPVSPPSPLGDGRVLSK